MANRVYMMYTSTNFRVRDVAGFLGLAWETEGMAMDVKDWLYGISKSTSVSMADMAAILGVSRQRLDNTLKNKTFRVERFLTIMEQIGVTIEYECTDFQIDDVQALVDRLIERNESCQSMLWLFEVLGIKMHLERKNGMPVGIVCHGYGYPIHTSKMLDGKVVQVLTKRSELICSSFFLDGEHEYEKDGSAREVYLDRKGRYYMVTYFDTPAKPHKITFLTKEDVEDLKEKFNGPEFILKKIAERDESADGDAPKELEVKLAEDSGADAPMTLQYTTAFSEWWKIFPRKRQKPMAFRRFQILVDQGWKPEELNEAATAYRKFCEDNQLRQDQIVYGATFLNADCYFKKYLPESRWDERQ